MGELKKKLHIGQRNVKTALTVALVTLVYLLIHRNPTFACIGVIFGMGSNMETSYLNGGDRFFGTLIGGLLGMGLFHIYIEFYPDGALHPLMLLFVFVGVVALIVLSQCFWVGAVKPGGVILCIILFNTPVETYVSYSLNRIFDTGVGVVVALAVNYLLPRERLTAILEKLHLRKRVEVTEE